MVLRPKTEGAGTKNPPRGSLVKKSIEGQSPKDSKIQLRKKNLKYHAVQALNQIVDKKYGKSFLDEYNEDPQTRGTVLQNLMRTDPEVLQGYQDETERLLQQPNFNLNEAVNEALRFVNSKRRPIGRRIRPKY